ncbi:MAG TPA: DUF3150 domain-containing protein [Opitutaceae bacterium]|nr:DUF3150 domain-containing protein [Opitutaceae bacterium]
MYHSVYVVDVKIRSIAGTHSITEEDLGLPPGTLPPEDLATLGNLITVDKKALAPGEKYRARTKRLVSSKGVKVGLGTVVTPADLNPLVDELKDFQKAFYDWKADFVASLPALIAARAAENPEYAELITRYAPDVRRVERRLSYDIDVFKFDVPGDDPNHGLLANTLQRSGNDISRRLLREVADFVENVHSVSIGKTKRLVKHNLGPLRDTLLPKIKSFQLLDSSLAPVATHLESLIVDVTSAIDARPGGNAFLEGSHLAPFEKRLNALRSVNGIEGLMASRPATTDTFVARPAAAPKAPPEPPVAPVPRSLPKRNPAPAQPQGRRQVVAF